MRFDLVDLRLFVNIYKAGSITAGAALSHLTLQSASERIRGMEKELGVPLLIRSKKGVKVSDAGYALVTHAFTVLQQVEHLRSEMHQFGQGLRGHITVLCNSSAQSEFLPELLGPYLLRKPNISVTIKEMLSSEIVQAIINQTASLGIVADSTALHGLASQPFRDDELVAIAPVDSHWHQRESVAFAEIAGEAFVGLSENSALQEHIEEQAKKLGQRLTYRVRLPTFDAIMLVVGSGVGMAIIPRHAAARYNCKTIRLLDSWATRQLLICARDFSALPGYMNDFVDFISPR